MRVTRLKRLFTQTLILALRFASLDYLVKKRQEVLDTLDLFHQYFPQLFNLNLGNVLDKD